MHNDRRFGSGEDPQHDHDNSLQNQLEALQRQLDSLRGIESSRHAPGDSWPDRDDAPQNTAHQNTMACQPDPVSFQHDHKIFQHDQSSSPHGDPEDGDADDPTVRFENIREIALRRLEQRDYSRGELSEYLVRRRGCDSEIVDQVLDRLAEVGLVDDERFAAQWVSSRRRTRKLSKRAIAQELRTKAVDPQIIDQALAQIDTDDEYQAALELCRQRAARMTGVSRDAAYRRLGGFLARRGYSAGVAMPVIRQVLDEGFADEL